ncbi:MAG: ABC transporter permease [Gemmatimonadota bacterium]|nr:MAG: ABC transporter permease [Gemmatimonadota bacterium]
MNEPKPPALARLLLALTAPERDRQFLIHDLAEEFHILIAEGRGKWEARRWYWHQVLASIPWSFKRGGPVMSRGTGDRLTQVTSLIQDIKHATRRLRTRPRFTVPAILTLALGIGANTTIFSVANTVLLRPLPFQQPDRLLTVWESNRELGRSQYPVSPPTLVDLRGNNRVFSHVAAVANKSFELTGGLHPQQVSAVMASPGMFTLLGIRMAEGGSFPATADEPGNDRVVVLSHSFWLRWFGGDPSAIGAALDLDGMQYRVLGVLPEYFWFPQAADLWAPLAFRPDELSEGMRGARYLQVYARLRPNTSIEQADAELTLLAEQLGAEHANNAGWTFELKPLADHLLEDYRRPLLLLLVAVGFVLCIACANVVNLVLVRAAEGQRETVVRTALGATRGRLLRESLIENTMLALAGGALGTVVAFWTVAPITRLAPEGIPRLGDVAVDGGVIAFCLIVSLAVGLALTAIVTMQRSYNTTDGVLRVCGARTGDRSMHRLRQALIVAEVALSLVLLVGAGLMLKSHALLTRVDPGFNTDGVLVASLSLPQARYGAAADQANFYTRVVESLGELDGVESVAATTNLPMAGSTMRFGFSIDDRPEASDGQQLHAEYHAASPDYFRTMGIALRGRSFQPSDIRGTVPVVIINEAMARQFWPDADPLGERLTVVSQSGPVSREIVGVIANVRHAGLASEPRLEVYVPLAQDPWPFIDLIIATSRDDRNLATRVRDQLAVLDPALPLNTMQPMDRLISEWLAPLRFQMLLIGAFASIALVMAMLGMYGVISYVVSRRTKEIGVRMALGADKGRVFRGVVGQAAALALTGIILGSVAALMLTSSLEAVLYEVSPTDPATFGAIALLVMVVSAAACFVPAGRAAGVDPVEALREE